jgi:hypothetical protein
MTFRILYCAAFAGYLLSFALPGLRMGEGFLGGWDSAMVLLSTLAYWNGALNYLVKLFLNLSNALTLLVFALQFAVGIRPLRWLQTLALVSGTYWIASAAYGRLTFHTFGVGFWLWYASLWALCLCTWAGGKPAGSSTVTAPAPDRRRMD